STLMIHLDSTSGSLLPTGASSMSNTSRSEHTYDLLKTESVRDPYAELDHFSLRCDSGDAAISHRPTRQAEPVRSHFLFDLKTQRQHFPRIEPADRLIG